MTDNSKNTARSGLQEIGRALDKLFAWLEACGVAQKNPVLLAGLLIVISIATALPSYSRFQISYGVPLLHAGIEWKFQHPLLPIPAKQIAEQVHCEDQVGGISHLEKISYRLLVPLIAQTFGFGTKTALAIQQVLACLFLLMTLVMLRQTFRDNLTALFASIVIAASFPGQWGFSDFCFFDGFAYFFIALSLWTKSPWVLATAIFAGGLTDERAILVTPLIWLWLGIRRGRSKNDFSLRSLLWPDASHLGLVIGIALFGAVRIYIALTWGAAYEASEILQWTILKKGIHFLSTVLMTGYKGGLLIFFVTVALLVARRQFTLLALAFCAMAPSLGAALMVWDLSRSFYYTFPTIFIAMAVLAQGCSINECRKITFCAAVGTVLFPTCYVLPFNIQLLNY